jgi:TetR/AcrR family transcriptional repressor of nem operon
MTNLETTAGGVVETAGRGASKRARLVSAARRTIHEQGAGQTTLAQIAAAAEVPVGNIYYYFKTKDELISAVISEYDGAYATLDLVLSQHETPKARLKALVRTWTAARERIAQYGCPIGSLCSELGKRTDDVSGEAARVLSRLIGVAEAQFVQLDRRDARELAVALVAAYEGVALIANALRNPALISAEADRLESWIDTL